MTPLREAINGIIREQRARAEYWVSQYGKYERNGLHDTALTYRYWAILEQRSAKTAKAWHKLVEKRQC